MKKIMATQSAKTPSGEIVTLYEIQEYPEAAAETSEQHPGLTRMELADGRAVTMVGRGEYKVDGTDEVFLVKDKGQGVEYGGVILTTPNRI